MCVQSGKRQLVNDDQFSIDHNNKYLPIILLGECMCDCLCVSIVVSSQDRPLVEDAGRIQIYNIQSCTLWGWGMQEGTLILP